MTAQIIAATQADQSEPAQDQAGVSASAASRAEFLLALVCKLTGYGNDLAHRLPQPDAPECLLSARRHYGTFDRDLILALISRGLHRAAILTAKLDRCIAQDAAASGAASLRLLSQPRTARPPARRADAGAARRARRAASSGIEAEILPRPVGAMISDICCDFGIMPGHELWPELTSAIVEYGGNLGTLLRTSARRARWTQVASSLPRAARRPLHVSQPLLTKT